METTETTSTTQTTVRPGDLVQLDWKNLQDIVEDDEYDLLQRYPTGLVLDVWTLNYTPHVAIEDRTTALVLFGHEEFEWYDWQLRVVSATSV